MHNVMHLRTVYAVFNVNSALLPFLVMVVYGSAIREANIELNTEHVHICVLSTAKKYVLFQIYRLYTLQVFRR